MTAVVEDLLIAPVFKNSIQLIGGKGGLNKKVQSITVMEVSDFTSFSLGEELFVLTTFSFCANDTGRMEQIFEELTQQNISALAIKINRYLEYIPDSLVDIADQKCIPLFKIESGVPFRNIITSVTSHVIESQFDSMKGLVDEYENLYHSILKGEKIDYFVRKIAKMVNKNCFCLIPSGSIIAQYILEPLIRNQELKNYIFELNNTPELVMDIGKKNESYMRTPNRNFYIFPCVGFDSIMGYFVVQSPEELDATSLLQIKQISTFISLKLMESTIQENQKEKEKLKILSDIFYEKTLSAEKIKLRLQSINFMPQNNYCLFFIKPDDYEYFKYKVIKNLNKSKKLERYLNEYTEHFLIEEFDEGYLILLTFSSSSGLATFNNFNDLVGNIEAIMDIRDGYKIGYSYVESNWGVIVAILKKVLHAIEYGKVVFPQRKLYATKDFVEFEILRSLLNSPEHSLFQERIICPLNSYDQSNHIQLWKTLETCILCETLQEAAEKLFVHTTTIRYRLEKVKELTGVDFFTAVGKLRLTNAYIFKKLEELTVTNK